MSKPETTLNFSAREMEVLALAWQCFDSEPKIDYKKLAALTGYTEGSAKVTLGNLKRKLKAVGSSADPSATPKKPATSKPKTPRSGKRGAKASGDESPTKKQKADANRATALDENEPEEEFDMKAYIKMEHDSELLRGLNEFQDDL